MVSLRQILISQDTHDMQYELLRCISAQKNVSLSLEIRFNQAGLIQTVEAVLARARAMNMSPLLVVDQILWQDL